MFKKEKSYLAW